MRTGVGLRGFEPPTPCPPDKCANQTAPQPVPSEARELRGSLLFDSLRYRLSSADHLLENAAKAWHALKAKPYRQDTTAQDN